MANFRKLIGKTFIGFEFEGNPMCEFNSDKKALLEKLLTIVHVEEERGYVEASEVALGKLYRFPLLVLLTKFCGFKQADCSQGPEERFSAMNQDQREKFFSNQHIHQMEVKDEQIIKSNYVEVVKAPENLHLVDCVKDSSFIGFINPEGKIKTYAVKTSGGFQITRPYSVVVLAVISRKRSMKELVNFYLKMNYRVFKFETHQDLVNWLKS